MIIAVEAPASQLAVQRLCSPGERVMYVCICMYVYIYIYIFTYIYIYRERERYR